MSPIDLVYLQRHLAYTAVGPTTLRRMFNVTGCRGRICDYLAAIDLSELVTRGVADALDRWTAELADTTGAWGPCRKALNLFLRDAAYNHWLRPAYQFEDIEINLELPLDRLVMSALKEREPCLPRPPAVKDLSKAISDQYQMAALGEANKAGVARVHLDLQLWNGGVAGMRSKSAA